MEYERIRDEIATIAKHWHEDTTDSYVCLAEQILSLDGIEIKADDQSLPGLLGYVSTASGMITQQDMLKAGFVKVIKKPYKEHK